MKIGVETWSFKNLYDRLNLLKMMEITKKIGCEGIEILDYSAWLQNIEEYFFFSSSVDWQKQSIHWINNLLISTVDQILKKAQILNLEIYALAPSPDFAQPSRVERARQVQTLKRWIQIADYMNVPVLRIFTGYTKIWYPYEDQVKWVVESIRECAVSAEQYGVKLAIENHSAILGQADELLWLIRKIDSNVVGIALHSHLPNQVSQVVDKSLGEKQQLEYVYQIVKKLAPHAFITHFPLSGEEEEYTFMKNVLDIYKDVGFDGFISLEVAGTIKGDPTPLLKEGVRNFKELRDKL